MPTESALSGQLDQFDRKIVDLLLKDGRLPVTEIAAQVGLSKTPCQNRVNRLRKEGVILGFRAVVDPEKLGQEQVAFVEVKMTDTTEAALQAFNAATLQVPQIEQCHMIAGAFDYLLKVRTKNMQDYRHILGEVISSLPHVGQTSTHVSMDSVKDRAF